MTAPTPAAGPEPAPTLSAFVKAHYALFAVVAGLTSVTAFATRFALGWVDTYLRFLLLGAALLVWLELLSHCPAELQLHRGRLPHGHPWRLVGFAYALQLIVLGFVGYVLWTVPQLLAPALAGGVAALGGVLGWRGLERRHGPRLRETAHARVWAVAAIVAAFLLSEVLLEFFVASHRSVSARLAGGAGARPVTPRPRRRLDLADRRFGRLLVLGRAPSRPRRPVWSCRCDRGQETTALASNLTSGQTRRCGCSRRERRRARPTPHGGSGSKEHRAWVAAV